MNNLQNIVKDNTRFAWHMAVELCEQGDFDNVSEAFRWLMQERDATTPGGGKLTAEQVRKCVQPVYYEGYNDGSVNRGAHIEETDWQALADELNATILKGGEHMIKDYWIYQKANVQCPWAIYVVKEYDARSPDVTLDYTLYSEHIDNDTHSISKVGLSFDTFDGYVEAIAGEIKRHAIVTYDDMAQLAKELFWIIRN